MRICIVTDAWRPQINGVVRVIETVRRELETLGHEVTILQPGAFVNVPMPTYREIRLAVFPARRLCKMIDAARPDAIHIATEGPLGMAARRLCLRRGWPFTTAYHTRFPEYVHSRTKLPLSWMYAWMRHFHRPATRVLVPAASTLKELEARGFKHLWLWAHGVDTRVFRRVTDDSPYADLPHPVFLFLGRIAVEKNLPAFLDLDLPGSKVVAGIGPERDSLEQRYPAVRFIQPKTDDDIVRCYSGADVFVFPSLTDTFGLVLLEALACELPVAAFPVAGPRDVLADADPHHPVGVLDADLRKAALEALDLDPRPCRPHAQAHDWTSVATLFVKALAPLPQSSAPAPAGLSAEVVRLPIGHTHQDEAPSRGPALPPAPEPDVPLRRARWHG